MASTPACRLGLPHKTVCHARGEYARDDDGDGFCEVHVNTLEGFWSLLRSWLRPHRGVSQEKLPLYLGFFQFVHNARRRGKALLSALIAGAGRVSQPHHPGCREEPQAKCRVSVEVALHHGPEFEGCLCAGFCCLVGERTLPRPGCGPGLGTRGRSS